MLTAAVLQSTGTQWGALKAGVTEQVGTERARAQTQQTTLNAGQCGGGNHRAGEDPGLGSAAQQFDFPDQGTPPMADAQCTGFIWRRALPALTQHPDTELPAGGSLQTPTQGAGIVQPGAPLGGHAKAAAARKQPVPVGRALK